MGQRGSEWMDALQEQDIPADVVDWDSIIAVPEDDTSADAERLDAARTIGEPPAAEEQHKSED